MQPCRSFVLGSPATSRRTRLLAFAGGRLACYQCASSSVAPGQSIVPLLCSRRLSGRSMPGLKRSHTRAHMLPQPPPPPHKTRPASLTLGGPGSLCGALQRRSGCTTRITMLSRRTQRAWETHTALRSGALMGSARCSAVSPACFSRSGDFCLGLKRPQPTQCTRSHMNEGKNEGFDVSNTNIR